MIYKDLVFSETDPLFKLLNKFLEHANHLDLEMVGRSSLNPPLGISDLFERQDGGSNASWMRRFGLPIQLETELGDRITKIFCDVMDREPIERKIVARTWYPSNGYLGWHIDKPGWRFYAAWAKGKSYFRYQNVEGRIITSHDQPGWNFRMFYSNPDNPLWHCVYAKDIRISLGYRFIMNLSELDTTQDSLG